MPVCNYVEFVVTDVPAATEFFREIVGLEARMSDLQYAELAAGSMTIILSPEPLVPMATAHGAALHFEVEDVEEAWAHALENGAQVLAEPGLTVWGWESVLIAGPEGIVIDFYHVLDSGGGS